MAIDFPDSPSVGQATVLGDKTWTWNGTVWNLVTSSGSDHGTLGGLQDDDHTHYALADGTRGTFEASGAVSTHEAASDPHTQYLLADGTRTATELTVSGDLTVDTDTLHVDSTNDRVGIGTTTPDAKLHVQIGASAAPASVPASHMIIADSAESTASGMAVYSPTNGDGYIRFGDPDNAASGGFQYDHAVDKMYFRTGGTDKGAIDSSGKVGIGTTSPSTNLHISSGTSGNAELRIEADTDNSNEADRSYLSFCADGGIIEGAVGLNDNSLVISNSVTSGQGIDFRVGTGNYYTTAADQIAANTTRMFIDSVGHVTMPYQPCFYAYRSGTNPTHGAGWSVMSFNAELFDSNGDYNTSTYRFVAPVTGNYQFNTTLNVYNVDVSQNATQFVISLYKNGVEQTRLYQGAQYTTASQDRNRSGSAVMRMNANDYAEIRVYSADTNYQLSAGQYWNSFSGFLIG